MSLNGRTGPRKSVVTTVFAALLLLLGIAAVPAAASAAPAAAPGSSNQDLSANHDELAAQARSGGLSSSQAEALQFKADAYLAKTGGTQVAINKIRVHGATILLALPGEKVARDLDAQPGAISAAYVCDYGLMCAYSGPNFTGDVVVAYGCTAYRLLFVGYGSWDNNQTPGTMVEFTGIDGTHWTSPPAHSWDLNFDWSSVLLVKNC